MPIYIRWPTNSRNISQSFEQKAEFPNVKGIIDGTLVHIEAPSEDEPSFVGRDNRHSINVIVVSGPKHEFFYVSAKCPGSFHDSRCLQVSSLWQSWENYGWRPDNDISSIILGDSAFPLKNWLINPNIRNIHANNRRLAPAIQSFLRSHRKTRFMVECAIGIWKEQFPCLNQFRIRSPRRISNAIYTCATLHNMQNKFRHGSYQFDQVLNMIANRDLNVDDEIFDFNDDNVVQDANEVDGVERQRFLLEYFAQR